MLVHCRPVTAIDFNIGKSRRLFNHDVVLGNAPDRHVEERDVRAPAISHCRYMGNGRREQAANGPHRMV
jgi:hypothetical protein